MLRHSTICYDKRAGVGLLYEREKPENKGEFAEDACVS
jgi:hypothetical protein